MFEIVILHVQGTGQKAVISFYKLTGRFKCELCPVNMRECLKLNTFLSLCICYIDFAESTLYVMSWGLNFMSVQAKSNPNVQPCFYACIKSTFGAVFCYRPQFQRHQYRVVFIACVQLANIMLLGWWNSVPLNRCCPEQRTKKSEEYFNFQNELHDLDFKCLVTDGTT
jgi:hypothetical protein